MIGLCYEFRILNLLENVTMLFIKCVRLHFCETEPSEVDKIEKTLQTMLLSDRILQHQYCVKNYQNYSDLVHDLLQPERHDELTLRNHHQCSIDSTPLLEVHHNVKGNEKVMDPTTIKTSLVNVVVQTILLRNAQPLNIWLNCTKDP
jgi:hypothetical protein